MVDRTADHPGREELQAYGQGRLPPEAAAALEEHLASCESCCELVETAPGDSFLGRLRAAGSVAPGDPGRDTGTYAGVTVTDVLAVPPELVDHPRYRVLGLVGQGGMGAVYRAEQIRMHRVVALKVINPGLMLRPAAVQRFQQEARAAARLDHPNIVRAHDADEAGALHFLVMEYVEGTSLAELVGERGPLPVAEACAYARQAALGLQHAHERGMVHRDIKPHNLMLQEGGAAPAGLVKILDFGLARLPRTPDGPSPGGAAEGPLTGAGAVLGSADYIAPEQADDPRAADIRADVYALGCTLFHLLTGRPPFPDGTVAEKLARHADTDLPAVTSLRPDVPPGLAAVLARMTAKAPAARYATPAEVAEALAPFCPAERPRPRKRGRVVVALALLAAGVLAGVAFRHFGTQRGEVVAPTDGTAPRPAVVEKGPEPPLAEKGSRPDPRPPEPPVREPDGLSVAEAEEKAARTIEKIGGKVERFEAAVHKPVISVKLRSTKVTDADLRTVAVFTRLWNLDLGGTEITDAGLKHLTGLTELQELTLTGTRVTDSGMSYVGELKQLERLDLQYTPVGDAGIKSLAGLTRLGKLKLSGPRVTDAALADVGRLKRLTVLYLDNTAVTDAGLKHLAGLTEMSELRLVQCEEVGDEGMKSVGRLAKLQSLNLHRTAVTDQGLTELAGLKQLSVLDLASLKVGDAGVQALLPGLTKLTSLDLSFTDVTDEGLKAVGGHPNLWFLSLQGAGKVTDAGMKELTGLPRLQVLLLAHTNVGDAGLRELVALPKLRSLWLQETAVTDAGLRELARCPNLQSVDLSRAKRVTGAGMEELRRARPDLHVRP